MKQNRGITFGTVFMLAVTALALGGFFVVAGKLGGAGIDLTHARIHTVALGTGETETPGEIRIGNEGGESTGEAARQDGNAQRHFRR